MNKSLFISPVMHSINTSLSSTSAETVQTPEVRKLFATDERRVNHRVDMPHQSTANSEFDYVLSLQHHLHQWRQRALEAELRAIKIQEEYETICSENTELREKLCKSEEIVKQYTEKYNMQYNNATTSASVSLMLEHLRNMWTKIIEVEYNQLFSIKESLVIEMTAKLCSQSSSLQTENEHTPQETNNYENSKRVSNSNKKKNMCGAQLHNNITERKICNKDAIEQYKEDAISSAVEKEQLTLINAINKASCDLHS